MNSCAGSVSGKEEVADMGACCPHTPARRKRTAGRPVVYLLGAKPPERRRTRRSRRILLWFRRRVELREFIDHWARSFDCGEYAFAQDAPCGRFGIEEFSIGIPVLATSGKSWQENKISRDILEGPDFLAIDPGLRLPLRQAPFGSEPQGRRQGRPQTPASGSEEITLSISRQKLLLRFKHLQRHRFDLRWCANGTRQRIEHQRMDG